MVVPIRSLTGWTAVAGLWLLGTARTGQSAWLVAVDSKARKSPVVICAKWLCGIVSRKRSRLEEKWSGGSGIGIIKQRDQSTTPWDQVGVPPEDLIGWMETRNYE